jgi:hypothetical protein
MRLLREEITEQACRTILLKLQDQKVENSGTTP